MILKSHLRDAIGSPGRGRARARAREGKKGGKRAWDVDDQEKVTIARRAWEREGGRREGGVPGQKMQWLVASRLQRV